MKTAACRAALVCILVAFLQRSSAQEKQAANNPAPTVEVTSARLDDHRMMLDWKIINHAEQTLYVYSTFLFKWGAAYRLQAPNRMVISTSLEQKLPGSVSYYPEAQFLPIARGRAFVGRLVADEVPDLKPTPDAVVLDISYGWQVTGVKAAIAKASEAEEHPGNPIVDWQSIAHSNVIYLRK